MFQIQVAVCCVLIFIAVTSAQQPFVVESGFSQLAHGLRSGPVTFLTERQVKIEGIYYDGFGPAAYFWVGTGRVSRNGEQIPSHTNTLDRLPRFTGETIMLLLPADKKWSDYEYLSMWCDIALQNFGDVKIPADVSLPPYTGGGGGASEETYENCQELSDNFYLNWQVRGDEMHLQFVGNLDRDGGYLAFGRSGSDSASEMIGADVMVAHWTEGNGVVDDYMLNAKAQCQINTGEGTCKDDLISGGVNDVEVTSSRQIDGQTQIGCKRKMSTGDSAADLEFTTDMYIVWATGTLGSDGLVTYHQSRTGEPTKLVAGEMCEGIREPEVLPPDFAPWPQTTIRGVTTFDVVIGPSGADRGYSAWTGTQSWGITFWVNDELAPILELQAGTEYTFNVRAGNNPDNSAEEHPLYITSSRTGGYKQATDEEKAQETVFAGVDDNGGATAGGPFCKYENYEINANDYDTFEAYKEDLEYTCEDGDAAVLKYTPTTETPAYIFYQCYTHRYLGWQIVVVGGVGYQENGTDVGIKTHSFIIAFLLCVQLVLKKLLC